MMKWQLKLTPFFMSLIFCASVSGHDLNHRDESFDILEGATSNQREESPFLQRQWGLNNSGQILLRASGELTRQRLQGSPGVDIDWLVDFEVPDPEREVVVAVIDSGIDINHPQLENRLWVDPDCDEERCHGFNFLHRDSNLDDETGHGTHVAGVIAANWDGRGVLGVGRENIKIMPLKVLSEDLDGFVYRGRLITDVMAEAIHYAREKGADVINMSLGWPQTVQTSRFENEVKKTLEANIPIIVAAGNNRKNIPTFPCTMEGVICVGAIDNRGEMAEFSNYGGKVDILAPGESILSLFPQYMESRNLRINGLETRRGTSQAAPFVSAIAASLILANPDIQMGELRARLFKSAHHTEKTVGMSRYGLVSMSRALTDSPQVFAEPSLKDVLEVVVGGNGNFELSFPIINWLDPIDELEVHYQIQGEGDTILVEGSELLSLGREGRAVVDISGHITSYAEDSHMSLQITLYDRTREREVFVGQSALVFSLDLAQREGFVTSDFDDQRLGQQVLQVQGPQALSRLAPADDPYGLSLGASYFYPQTNQNTGEVRLNIFEVGADAVSKYTPLHLPPVNRVLSVLLTEIKGERVWVIYSMKDAHTLLLSFYDKKAKPLHGENSHWQMPITEFGGLPVSSGRHNFQWIEIDSPAMGQVMVPAFAREGFVPDEDNSANPMERLPRVRRRHLYYLEPIISEDSETIELRTRVFDNYQRREQLHSQLRLIYGEEIEFMPILPQSKSQLESAELVVPIAVGRPFDRRVIGLEISASLDFALIQWDQSQLFLDGNSMRPSFSLEREQARGENFSFVTLFDRQNLRVADMSAQSGVKGFFDAETETWADQVFNPLASFNDGDRSYHFVESRYHIYSLSRASGNDGTVRRQKLPINRDSAFPGVQFAETFEPLRILGEGRARAGVFVNSRLIYGNLIYTMTHSDFEGRFIRPLELSWQIPTGCVPLNTFEDEFSATYLSLICRDRASGRTIWATTPF